MSAPATPVTGDLLYGEEAEDLRASVRALLDRQAPWDAVLARVDTDEPVDTDLWARLAREVGAAGLAVGEEQGGAGASWREAAVVAEELGRAVAPVPFLGSAVLATAALLDVTPTRESDDLLAALASGTRTAALAVPAVAAPGTPVAVTVEVAVTGLRRGSSASLRAADGVLRGRVDGVLDATAADVLLVPTDEGLFAVDASGAGVRREVVTSLDMTRRLTDLTLDGASGVRLAEDASAPVGRALAVGAAVLASEQLGLAERCLADTVSYLRDRHQFGRSLASYQALKHRLADVWVAITQARAVARYAARCAADEGGDTERSGAGPSTDDLPVAVAVASARCSDVVVLAAEEALQLHGGIGFTWEHPAHLLLKRAKASAAILGSPARHRAVLAGLVDLPG